MSQMAKFDRGLLQRRLGQPVRVADDYVDLLDILRGFDPTASGLGPGLVFLFEADGRPNPDFFRWVSGMGGRGKRSLESRRGYAYDVAGWIDFLHDAYQTDYLDAQFEDLEEYARELRTASEDPVSGDTWNRKLAAIHDFYLSLERDGRLQPGDGPFAEPDACRELRSRAVGAQAVRYLLLPQLRYFVDVGIRGYRPDGTIDTAFRGGYPGRDACMANILATTGMRRNEMRSLTTVEVDLGALPRQGRRLLVGAPAKGGRPGEVIVPRRTLEDLRAYVAGDRDVIVSVANSTGSLRRQEPTMIVVEEIDERRQTVKGWDRAGNRGFAKPVSAMSVDERHRAYWRKAGQWEPLALFVGEGGSMISGSLVNRVFETANPPHLVLPNGCRGDRDATEGHASLDAAHVRHAPDVDADARSHRARQPAHPPAPRTRRARSTGVWAVSDVAGPGRPGTHAAPVPENHLALPLSPWRARPQRDRIGR
jgi:integrase